MTISSHPQCSILSTGTRTLTGNHGPTSTNLSLEIKSDLALFAIQNSTYGIIISITPLCSDHICSTPHSLLVEGVFLPDECTVVPCSEHLLINTTALSDATVQYVIGVPSVQSLLLLRFYYHVKSHVFELKEKVIASKGIMDCNPTAVTFVNEVYFTLCVNGSESEFLVYRINLEDFSDVIFSQIIDHFSTLNLPIADVAALSGILDNFILFVGGRELIVINTDDYTFERNYFDECTREIYQISPRNTSEMEDAIPFLLYCDSDYGVIDVLEVDSSDPLRYYYNKTGYPVVCRDQDTVVSEVAIFADSMNNTLKHNANNFTLPGRQILPKTSLCFAVENTLFYLYSDRVLGSVMVSLQGDDLRVLFSEVCKWSGCSFRVVEDRYVLLTEQFNDTNARLRVYDVLQQDFVSENTVNASTSLMLLIALPQPPPNWLAINLGSIFGGGVPLLAIGGTVLGLIIR